MNAKDLAKKFHIPVKVIKKIIIANKLTVKNQEHMKQVDRYLNQENIKAKKAAEAKLKRRTSKPSAIQEVFNKPR